MKALLTQRPFGAALLAGALAGLGQAPVSLPFITLICLGGWVWLHLHSETPKRAAWIGWGFGVGYFAVTLHWIVEPFFVEQATVWMSPFALAGMAAGMALFWGAAAGLARGVAPAGVRAAVAWAAAVGAMELARSYILTGFPWALIGHVWIGWFPMQMAAWGGPHGMTFWTLIAVALGVAFWPRKGRLAGALVAAAVVPVAAYLLAPEPTGPVGPTIRMVQPNAPQHLKWHPDHAYGYFDRAVSFTGEGARPELIIWPETAVPSLLEYAGGPLGLVRDAADGVPVVLGIQRRVQEDYYNSLLVLSGDGEISDIYDKHHLVPFGEYMPAPGFFKRFGILGLASRAEGGYTPGPGSEILDLGALGTALPLICYEAIFPQHSRAAERPDWLLQITNDAWFGNLVGPYQHLAQARLRAVEQGLPMVRVANTGVSAVIDARGRILAELPLNVEGHLDAPLPSPLAPTLYARTGDWPALAVYLLLLLIIITARYVNRH